MAPEKSLPVKHHLGSTMPDLSLPRQERSAKNTPKRSSSNIIRRGLNSLLGSSRAESPPPLPRSGLQWEEPDESENRDTLPCGKANLEARLNYHLSELDRLRNYIQLMNQIICEHETRLADISARGMGMDVSVQKLEILVHDTRRARNVYGKHIGYHRIEVERITKKKLHENHLAGEEPAMPEVVKNLPNDYEWRDLFLA